MKDKNQKPSKGKKVYLTTGKNVSRPKKKK